MTEQNIGTMIQNQLKVRSTIIKYKTKMVEYAGVYFFCTFLSVFVLNLPFIVCDFVFAVKNGCAQFDIQGMELTLQSWLIIDAISRVLIILLFLISCIVSLFKQQVGKKMRRYSFLGLGIFTLLQLGWMIVGGVLYWGNLNMKCDGMTIGYMYSMLILGFVNFIPCGMISLRSWLAFKE